MAGELAGAAQGAAIGTAVMPGVGTAIGAVAGALLGGSSVAGGGGSGGGAMATPQASQAAALGSGLDGSGWIVQTGNGNSATLDNRQDKTITATGPTATAVPTASASPYGSYLGGVGSTGLESLSSIPPLVWLALAGAVVWKLSKSKK